MFISFNAHTLLDLQRKSGKCEDDGDDSKIVNEYRRPGKKQFMLRFIV